MRNFFLLTTLLIPLTFSSNANALSCGRINAEDLYASYSYIFTGKVDEVSDGKVVFSSVESFREELPSQLTASYACTKKDDKCLWNTQFTEGKEYIIYAQKNDDGDIEISKQLCIPITTKESAKNNINSFRAAKNNKMFFPLPRCSKDDFFSLIETSKNVFFGKIEKQEEYPDLLDIGGTAFYAKQKVKILKVWKGDLKKDTDIDILSGGNFDNFPYPEIKRNLENPEMYSDTGGIEGIFLTRKMIGKDGKTYEIVFDCNGFIQNPHFTPFNQSAWRNTNYFDQVETYFGNQVPECKKATSIERTLKYENDLELSKCLINSAVKISAPKSWYTEQLVYVLEYNYKSIGSSLLTEQLLKNGADPNYTKDGIPVLFQAIISATNSFGIKNVELLLKYGANPNIKYRGQTPIEYAQSFVNNLEYMNNHEKTNNEQYSENNSANRVQDIKNGKEIINLLKKYSTKKSK